MSSTCRLCLKNGAELNIFCENSTIHEKLLSYCKLEIFKNDGLPEQACNLCVKQLDVVVEFIDKCEESDKVLRNEHAQKYSRNEDIIVKQEQDNQTSLISIKCLKNEDDYDADFALESFDTNSISIKDEFVVYKDEKIYLCPSDLVIGIPKADSKCNLSKSNKKDFENTKPKCRKINPNSCMRRKKSKSKCAPHIEVKDENKLNNELNINVSKTIIFNDILRNSKIKTDFDELDTNAISVEKSQTKVIKRNRKSQSSLRSRKSISHNNADSKDATRRRNRKSKYDDESSLCPVCGKSFPQSKALRQHIQKHSGIKHKCSKCPKTFSTRELMKVHEHRHLHIRGFPCQVCGNTFASSYLSKKHFQLVHQRVQAVACKLCDKILSNQRCLNEHMKIHTGEKNFECQLCHKKFAHKLSLTCHIRVHTGEQPYACQYCEKRFSINKSLKEHERLHTGEKPYVCPICPKRFEQLSNMKSHFRYNHKGLDFKKVQALKADSKN